MGVIDAIADGCFAVARRPLVLVPVVALDLLYWLGGRLTAAPFTAGIIRLLELAPQQSPGGPDPAETIATLRLLGQETDLFGLLTLGQHPLLLQLTVEQVARPWGVGIIDVGNWGIVLLLAVVLTVLGILLLAVSLSLLAPLARQEPFSFVAVLRQVPRCWLRLLGLCAVIVAGFGLLLLPLLILATIMTLLGLSTALLGVLLTVPLLVLYVYLALAPEAIAVSDVGPLRAIKLSIGVVRRNFWPTSGLIAAIVLLNNGLPYGWALLTQQAAGVPLAIVGNGFIATGLMAAAMFFYRERLSALETSIPGKSEVVGTK
ncbi:MAG TPA: hypothetical protein VIL85_05365 [Thermomicrobiales bacterium]